MATFVLLRVILGVCSSAGSAQCLVGLALTAAPTKIFSHIQARACKPSLWSLSVFRERTSIGLLSVRVSQEQLAVDCFHPLAAYLSGWGGAERCRRSWRSLAVQRVGPVLPHGVIPVGVDLCVGAGMGGLLLQEQALCKCLQTADCSNRFK